MIYLGSDHAGFYLKQAIKKFLDSKNLMYQDLGGFSTKKPDDYPDYAEVVAKAVVKNKDNRGILICGTGTGMVIAANKIKGVRASVVYDAYTAKMSRKDNDSNIMCLGARDKPHSVNTLLNVWLKTLFSNKPRHKRRIEKIKKLEK